jgi:hypothetical protein
VTCVRNGSFVGLLGCVQHLVAHMAKGGNTVSHPWCRLRWFEDTTSSVHARRGLRGKVDVLVTHLCLVGFLRLLPRACRLQLEQDPKAQHACKRGQRGSTQGRRHRQHASKTPIGSSPHMTPARTEHSSTGRGERPGINLKRVSSLHQRAPLCAAATRYSSAQPCVQQRQGTPARSPGTRHTQPAQAATHLAWPT